MPRRSPKAGHHNDDNNSSLSGNSTHDLENNSKSFASSGNAVQNRSLNCARTSVVTYLLATAAILGALSYTFVDRQPDAASFQEAWNTIADQVETVALKNVANIYDNVAMVANLYPAIADETGASLPFVTIKDFDALAGSARKQSGALLLGYAPYLYDDMMKAEWETYAAGEASWAAPQTFNHEVWKYNANGDIELSDQPPYLPSWQMTPRPKANEMVNFDYLSRAVPRAFFQSLVLSKNTVMSAPFDVRSIYGVNTELLDQGMAASLVMSPVWNDIMGDSLRQDIVGVITALMPWSSVLDGTVRNGEKGVMAVVESCGTNNTFVLSDGSVFALPPGDHHEEEHGHYVKSFTLIGAPEDAVMDDNVCQHKVHLFPSDRTVKSLANTATEPAANDAATLTSVVVVLVVLGAVVFCLYDGYLRRQYLRAIESASRTDALVNHMVPAVDMNNQMIRRQSSASLKNVKATKTLDTSDGDSSDDAPAVVEKPVEQQAQEQEKPSLEQPIETKDALMKYVNVSAQIEKGTKPLAELFPDATVLFADIAGFTAWSSIREPSQVFTLLESIFGAFDAIAQEMGVFKVETVGDCYVAVCGLPEPNKEHAIVMAKFARGCMDKVNEVIRELELTLGPDTAELAMRFGIHSGPITAGVLRGDRARFQLFGDTVNTAARIESTGKRNRIHLSEQTASLIMATGRKNWVIERDDPVEAKGKGVMKTFWLLTLRGERDTENSTQAENKEGGQGDDQEYVPKSSFMERIKAIKENRASKERRIQRLVQWNSEMLIQLLKQVVARRQALERRQTSSAALNAMANNIGNGCIVVEEVAEIITLPEFDATTVSKNATSVNLPEKVIEQVHAYVGVVAGMYNENPFHNFEHASHVTMSVSKLLSRIVAPHIDQAKLSQDEAARQAVLHDHTYGITSDPLTQFAVVLSALIHDVDHRGVPNFILNNEEATLAAAYKQKSVAEQNSIDLAWKALLSDEFEDLRAAIFADVSELRRFRQLLVNSVIATDIFDKELGAARKARWEKAFSEEFEEAEHVAKNRKATIVIEHLIQASDVAHTMQHWHVYLKWNERLFQEMYEAYAKGRSQTDPSVNWFQGEIGFLDNYVIPLAKKLKNCGVFGVSSDEYLNYAQENRREWSARGKDIVDGFIEKHAKKSKPTDSAQSDAAPPTEKKE